MNFKKPLSLLMIVGLVAGMSATDNEVVKHELEEKVKHSYNETSAWNNASLGFGLATAMGFLLFYELKKTDDTILNLVAEKTLSNNLSQAYSLVRELDTSFYKMTFTFFTASLSGLYSLACLSESYQANKKAEEAQQELAELESNQT